MATLVGELVLITGTSSGIGLSAAVECAVAGHRVIATMRNPERRAALLGAAAARGVTVDVEQLDVTASGAADKLRELTLKYDLPISIVNTVAKGYIRNAAISLSGRNLYTWTRYQGLDPEVSNFGSQQISRAQDVTPYPPTRSYFISLDLGF